ncbi:MAG: FGGY-family carbohydrate kinase [Actinomycetota bacterium]|nr:FGGY-family carbohydrate kinase [Actinomycetota bacterium]
MAFVLSLDSSTTATKAVVWDRDGRSVADGRAPHPTALPRPGWNEQDPEDWWSSATSAVDQALLSVESADVEALVVTHQRETFACLDDQGRAVRPAIVWMDVRAAPQVESFGSAEIHRLTGKPPDTTPALYKLLWLREHEPEVMARTRWVVDVHAYLMYRLTGVMRTTTGCADPLGLIDLQGGDWADALLELCGLDRAQMPELVAPGEVLGSLGEAPGDALGLRAGLPVVGGTGDGQAVGVGANVLDSSRAYLNLGTAIVAGTATAEYRWERAFRTLTGPLPETFTLETLIQGGTYTLNWFLRRIAGLDAERLNLGLEDVDLLEAAATRVPPGAEGLLLVPYWASSQTPYWDPYARGMLFGLAGHHGKEHMFRAMLEGIAFEQRLALGDMQRALGAPVQALMTTGGGSRSALWRQILADVCGTTIVACREEETTSLGAAIYAAVAAGWYPSLSDAAAAMTGEGARHTPDPATSARYDRLYAVYRELYPRTAELHRALQEALED